MAELHAELGFLLEAGLKMWLATSIWTRHVHVTSLWLWRKAKMTRWFILIWTLLCQDASTNVVSTCIPLGITGCIVHVFALKRPQSFLSLSSTFLIQCLEFIRLLHFIISHDSHGNESILYPRIPTTFRPSNIIFHSLLFSPQAEIKKV